MKPLDRKVLQRFLKLAGARLSGNWVLMGGTVLPAMNLEHRATTDIDIVGLDNPNQAETLKLMELTEELGLPIESINQAGAYFLLKIPHFREHLVPLHRGENATIFRPDAFLYVQLKIARLTESDLGDCLEFLKLSSKRNEPWDAAALQKLVSQEIKRSDSPKKIQRLETLLEWLKK